jgi:hypothetical protein
MGHEQVPLAVTTDGVKSDVVQTCPFEWFDDLMTRSVEDVFAVASSREGWQGSHLLVAGRDVRTPDGPRQRTLCYLGEVNSSAQARWFKSIEVFNEQGETQ